MLRCEAWQYHLSHLGRVYSGDWVFLDVALQVKPVAECSYGSIISVLALMAVEISQEVIDIIRCEIVIDDERLKARLVEFECAW